MRSIGSLLLLGLALVLLHHYTAGAPLAARATLSLGTMVFLAELAGRLASRWRLPRVAVFVAVGIACAPAMLGLVRADEARSLAFLGDAALALFVLRAGLGSRRASATGLARYLTGSVVFPFVLTAATVYAAHRWFPLTVHQPRGDALGVALALGAITVVAAPALTWATLHDAPGGALPDALLRLNVQREFVAVALFMAALAAATAFTSPGALEPRALLQPLSAFGRSILVGGLLAWLASRYLRLLGGSPGVFWLALAFGAAVAAWTGGAEVTLAALVAGLTLARIDHDGAELLRTHFDVRGVGLASAAFALVGLGLDASILADVWPWILLLVVVRAAGLLLGDRLGGRHPLVSEAVAPRGWAGLVSQGGMALFLAGVGRRAFPEWGVSFEALVVGLVVVHAVMGPICLRWAVARRPFLMEGDSRGT
jgi:Kef-type K+ transport system membrane component KefB